MRLATWAFLVGFCVFSCSSAFSDTHAHHKFKSSNLVISGQVFRNGSPLADAEITIKHRHTVIGNLSTLENGMFSVELELNSEFYIVVNYPGCYEKAVNVSTMIYDEGALFDWQFEFNVNMIDKLVSTDTLKALMKPVGKIRYYGFERGFDYDNKYTDKVQAKLMEEVKTETVKSALIIEQRKDDEAAKLKLQADKDAKNERMRLEKEKMRRAAQLEDSLAKVYRAEAERERKESFEKNKAAEPPKETVEVNKYPKGVTEETIDEKNRKINRVVINNLKTQAVFQEVKYNWGGVFYFKNGSSITKDTYFQELDRLKKEAANP